MNKYISDSEQSTIEFASWWVKTLRLGEFPTLILLNGDYGAGKTQFVKGLAQGLGVGSNVSSPSYTYIREYEFRYMDRPGMLVHVDAWRANNVEELKQTGVLNYLEPGNIVAIEWGHKAKELDFDGVRVIEIDISETGIDEREININEGY